MRKSESEVEEWFEKIADGLEYRCQYGMEHDWSKVEAMFYAGHAANKTSGSNLIYSTGDAFLSTIHTPAPFMLVNPKRIEQIDWAPCVESMDNGLICDMKMKREADTCGLYAYLWGSSFLKIGYDSEYGFNPALDIGGTAQPMGITLSRFARDQNLIEYSDNKPGMPWVKAVAPHDIVVPWGTRDLDNCPWIAHRVVRHIDAIKADPKYSGTRDLKPVMSMKDFVESYQTIMKPYRIGPDLLSTSTEGTEEAEFVELWEIHDKITHQIYVIATGHKKFLRNEVNHLQLNGLPFVDLGFVPKGRTLWRTSDAIYLLPHQAEISDITIQMRKQRRLNVLKGVVKKGAFNEDEKRKLLSRDVGATAEADTKGGSIQDVFTTLPMSNANQYLQAEAEDVRSAARETVGFDRNSYGEYRGARTTATEVDAVQQSKQFRMGRRQTILAEFYQDAMRKVNGICFKFWTAPKVMQVLGVDGIQQWMKFAPQELKGDYSLEVIFDDAPQSTLSGRQQQAIMLYQASMTDPSVDPIQARRYLARSTRDGSVGGLFKPGVMPGTVPQMGGGQGGQAGPGVQQGGGSGSRIPAR